MRPGKRNTDEVSIELDKKKLVTVRLFNGVSLVDIREFYIDMQSGERKPGKKGIALTQEAWEKLISVKDEVNDALNALGGSKRQKQEENEKEKVRPERKQKREKKNTQGDAEQQEDMDVNNTRDQGVVGGNQGVELADEVSIAEEGTKKIRVKQEQSMYQ